MLRFVILAALIYMGYLLFVDGRKKKRKQSDMPNSATNTPVTDILVEDPICHNLVPKQQAIHLQHQGAMVYFCSEECCTRFLAQEGESR